MNIINIYVCIYNKYNFDMHMYAGTVLNVVFHYSHHIYLYIY